MTDEFYTGRSRRRRSRMGWGQAGASCTEQVAAVAELANGFASKWSG